MVKKYFFFFWGGGSKKGLNKKNCVKDIFWVKNFLVKGIFGVRKFCSKKFKVEKCFKVEKILWSKSFWSLKLLLHYSFCEKVHFHILQESFEFLAAMSSSRSDDVTNLSHFLLMLFFNAFLKLHFEHYEHSEHTDIVQKNRWFWKGIGIQNFSGPSSYSLKRNRNYSFILIPLKGKEYMNLPEL